MADNTQVHASPPAEDARILQARAEADAQRRQIGEMRITIALEQMRPRPRSIRAFMLANGSQSIRPRYGKAHLDWAWMDSATVIVGAAPLAAQSPFLEIIDGGPDGHAG